MEHVILGKLVAAYHRIIGIGGVENWGCRFFCDTGHDCNPGLRFC